MRIRFKFEIDPGATLDLDPADFAECETVEYLHYELLEYPNPSWRVSINDDDLVAFWEAVQQLRREMK